MAKTSSNRCRGLGLGLLLLGLACLWSKHCRDDSPAVTVVLPLVARPSPISLRGKRVVMRADSVHDVLLKEKEVTDTAPDKPKESEKSKAKPKKVKEAEQGNPLANKKRRLAAIELPFGNVSLDLSMMSYNQFVPRLYNMCKNLGFKKGKILPSIGFCSDENQGYPTILITKHFGAYPFNHGYIGGIMALDRHGPHAAHADDVVLVHAPHVGFEPDLQEYGTYRRRQIEAGEQSGDMQMSGTCGKVVGVLTPYVNAYQTLLGQVRVRVEGEQVLIGLSRLLLPSPEKSDQGISISLRFDQLLEEGALENPVVKRSTSSTFRASAAFARKFQQLIATEGFEEKYFDDGQSLANPKLTQLLTADMFVFVRPAEELQGEEHRLERSLVPNLPEVLTSPYDNELSASLICMQSEFDRSAHSVAREPSYKGKNLMLISGLNIDVSPAQDLEEAFPTTMFLPWAAYVQTKDGNSRVIEQHDLVSELFLQPTENADAIDMEKSIEDLFVRKRSRITFFDRNTNKNMAAQVL